MGWDGAVRDPARLAALERSGLLGGRADDAFDRLIELATELVGAPRGCITLVDGVTTRAMSAVGFPEGLVLVAPIEQSFCRFVVAAGQPLIVDDAENDPRTAGDPAIAAFGALAWAGYPIEEPGGAVLGTFCVFDAAPHRWRPIDLHLLATLAAAASSEIALRAARRYAVQQRDESDRLRVALTTIDDLVVAHAVELAAFGDAPHELGGELVTATRSLAVGSCLHGLDGNWRDGRRRRDRDENEMDGPVAAVSEDEQPTPVQQ